MGNVEKSYIATKMLVLLSIVDFESMNGNFEFKAWLNVGSTNNHHHFVFPFKAICLFGGHKTVDQIYYKIHLQQATSPEKQRLCGPSAKNEKTR